MQTSFRVPASAPSARPQLRSDVVRTLEQSNSDEGLISVDVASEESSSKARPCFALALFRLSRTPYAHFALFSAGDVARTRSGPHGVVGATRHDGRTRGGRHEAARLEAQGPHYPRTRPDYAASRRSGAPYFSSSLLLLSIRHHL